MNIYIPIEIKVRELEGRCLLAFMAAARGHRVLLGGKEDTIRLPLRGELPPGIIHHKGVFPGKTDASLLNERYDRGYVMTTQDEESGTLASDFTAFGNSRFPERGLELQKRVFCWGRHDQEWLEENKQKYASKFVKTGSPRVDYWRPEFSSYFDKQQTENYLKNKSYVLFASNLSGPLSMFKLAEHVSWLHEIGHVEKNPEVLSRTYKHWAWASEMAGEFVQLITYLSKEFPDYTFVFRPHPTESIESWRALLPMRYENIMISREGGISAWIRNASVLVHNSCTSALEAAAVGTPRIAFRPIRSDFEQDVPNLVSVNTSTVEETSAALKTILQPSNGEPEAFDLSAAEGFAREILNNRFANLNGRYASELIVEAWEMIASEDLLMADQLSCRKHFRRQWAQRTRSGLVRLKNQVQRDKNRLSFLQNKFPGLHACEVQNILKALVAIFPEFERLRVKKWGSRSVLIWKTDSER